MKNYKKYCLTIVIFIAVYNLIDFILSTFITRDGYRFSTSLDLVVPIVMAYLYLRTREKEDALIEKVKSADQNTEED